MILLVFLDLGYNVMTFHHLLFQNTLQTARGAETKRKTRKRVPYKWKKRRATNLQHFVNTQGKDEAIKKTQRTFFPVN